MKFERLGDIVIIEKGKKPKFSESTNENSIRVLQIDDLRNDNNIKYTDEKSGVKAYENDILLAWDGANAGTIGYGKIGYIGSTIAVLRKRKPNAFATVFIGKFLQTKTEFLRRKSTGATIPHIDRKSLENILVPVFPLPDQIRISTILSKVEDLINQRKESIALLDEFLKGTFWKMFGDPIKNEKRWGTIKLGELGEWKSGGTPLRNTKEFYEGNIPWITSGELNTLYIADSKEKISENAIRNSNASLIKVKSLLLGMYDTAALKSSINTKVITCNQAIAFAKLHFEKCETLFVYFNIQMGKDFYKSKQRGVRQQNMNLSMIKKMRILNPPLALQTHFAQIAEKTEAIREQYQNILYKLENLYGSISQRAFKGEIDLSRLDVLYEEEYSNRDNDRTEPQDFDKPVNFENINVQIKKQKYYGGGDNVISMTDIGGTKISQSVESRINEKTDSVWRLYKTTDNVEGIKFNNIEGQAVMEDVFSKRSSGFSFTEFTQFLKKEQLQFSYHQVRDFIFNQLEEKKLYQFYASKEWMQSDFKKVNQDQDDFGGEGNIWFLVNNSLNIK